MATTMATTLDPSNRNREKSGEDGDRRTIYIRPSAAGVSNESVHHEYRAARHRHGHTRRRRRSERSSAASLSYSDVPAIVKYIQQCREMEHSSKLARGEVNVPTFRECASGPRYSATPEVYKCIVMDIPSTQSKRLRLRGTQRKRAYIDTLDVGRLARHLKADGIISGHCRAPENVIRTLAQVVYADDAVV